MPELPDVEIFRRDVAASALRQPIRRVHVGARRLLAGTTPQALQRALVHHRFNSTLRRGKYLFAGLDNRQWIMFHFGMTGRPEYVKRGAAAPDHAELLIDFDNGARLAYVTLRKLGRIALTDDPETYIEEHRLGPDALSLDRRAFGELAAGARGSVKGWLLDQTAIAGIGTIYGDEMLFQARIDPRRKVSDLDQAELTRLHRQMRRVLERAIAVRAEPGRMPRSWLIHHRSKGEHCPRCQGTVRRTTIAGRPTWYCPRCQR